MRGEDNLSRKCYCWEPSTTSFRSVPNRNYLSSFLLHRSSLKVRVQLFFIWASLFPHMRLLLRTFSRMYLCFWMWRMSINATKWTFLIFCCAPSFMTSFHSSHSIDAFASGINVAWVKIFCLCSCFPKHASLRDRSPESSAPYVTLYCRSSLNRTTFEVSYFLLPKFSIESISYSLDFKIYLKNFSLTDTLCRETRQHAPASTFRDIKLRAFLRSCHRNEFLREVVEENRNPSFPAMST